jgi:RNA polymerase sigma-70 factor (ECF subfamily)
MAPFTPGRDTEGALSVESLGAALAAVAKHADRSAFAHLFRHFAPRVKAYLLRLGADEAAAEDLMQEVMLTVWRRAPTYDPSLAGVSTWIFTIARNRRIDALRRSGRPAGELDDPSLQPNAPASPDDFAAAQQWEEKIAAAIENLPPEQAEMLRLAYFDDRSHSEIAGALNVPLGTVKSRLRLAVGRLRSIFESEDKS